MENQSNVLDIKNIGVKKKMGGSLFKLSAIASLLIIGSVTYAIPITSPYTTEDEYTKTIKKGWSLISLPDDFSLNSQSYKALWSYSQGKWSAYSPDNEMYKKMSEKVDLISTIDSNQGYWIFVDEDTELTYQNDAEISFNIGNKNITDGWNLVNTTSNITDMSIFSTMNILWYYEDKKWSAYSPDITLQNIIKNNSSYIELLSYIPKYSGFWVFKNSLNEIVQDYPTQTISVTDDNSMVQAYFIDSPVENLAYINVDSNGNKSKVGGAITTSNGGFVCDLNSAYVEFYIQNIYLGKTKCNAKVFTPYDLENSNSTKANNQLRVLQTLDTDGNPDNGITLPKYKIENTSIEEFKSFPIDFESDEKISKILSENFDEDIALKFKEITPEKAQEHFDNYENEINTILSKLETAIKNTTIYESNDNFKEIFDKLIETKSIHLLKNQDTSNKIPQIFAVSTNKYNLGSENIGSIFLNVEMFDLENNIEYLYGSIVHEVTHIVDYNEDKEGFTSLDTEINAHSNEYRYYITDTNKDPKVIMKNDTDMTKNKKIIFDYKYGFTKTKEDAFEALKDMGYEEEVLNSLINPNYVKKTTPPTLLKKTGQTKSYADYDDGYYQTGIERSYSRDDTKQIVTDNVTKLQWQDDSDTSSKQMDWSSAIDYCSDLTLGGYSDWSLPTRKQLVSLSDYGRYTPAINPIFQNIGSNNWYSYWSSTTVANYSYNAWRVGFGNGNQDNYYKSNDYYVRCVRAGE